MIRRAALLTLVCLATSSCAVLGFRSECEGTEVIAEFEEVGDLVENANVQSSDVVIGTITEIALDEDAWHADVTMCLDAGQQVSSDVGATVRSTSLLGEKFIELNVDSAGSSFLEDGDVISVARTSKATELEEIFTKLASILGTGNLEQVNQLTASQAQILSGRETELRELLSGLRRFTGTLADRKGQIASAIDSLDAVAGTVLDDSATLERFLESFAGASTVLADQRNALQDLLRTLDRFSAVSLRLLAKTETDLGVQFEKLRPVLRTAAANSAELAEGLRTLATFTVMWPETMPGDYLQLDVCQAGEEDYDTGENCPQSEQRDHEGPSSSAVPRHTTSLEFILNQPLRGESR